MCARLTFSLANAQRYAQTFSIEWNWSASLGPGQIHGINLERVTGKLHQPAIVREWPALSFILNPQLRRLRPADYEGGNDGRGGDEASGGKENLLYQETRLNHPISSPFLPVAIFLSLPVSLILFFELACGVDGGAFASFVVPEARELRPERSFSDDGRYEWIFWSMRVLFVKHRNGLLDENVIIKWSFVNVCASIFKSSLI